MHIARFRIFGVELVLSAKRRTIDVLRETENWRTCRPFYGLGVCEPQVPECWWVGPVPVPCVPCNAFFPPKKHIWSKCAQKNTFAL